MIKSPTLFFDTEIFLFSRLILLFILIFLYWLSVGRLFFASHQYAFFPRHIFFNYKKIDNECRLYYLAELGKNFVGHLHELANPMTALAINLEDLKAKNKRMGVNLDLACQITGRIENQLDAISRPLQTKRKNKRFSANASISQALDLCVYQAKRHQVELYFFDKAKIFLQGDEFKFRQAIYNLLVNAIESYEGLEMKNKLAIVSLEQEEKIVRLSIRDHGKGIDEAMLKNIFKPFYTSKRQPRNLGLGLNLSKQIIEDVFHGKILLFSKLGAGSEVMIKLKKD